MEKLRQSVEALSNYAESALLAAQLQAQVSLSLLKAILGEDEQARREATDTAIDEFSEVLRYLKNAAAATEDLTANG